MSLAEGAYSLYDGLCMERAPTVPDCIYCQTLRRVSSTSDFCRLSPYGGGLSPSANARITKTAAGLKPSRTKRWR